MFSSPQDPVLTESLELTELTPEQIVWLDETPQAMWSPTTEYGQLFFDAGHEDKAQRLERCGLTRFRRCEGGHIDRRIKQNCEFRFACFTCAEGLARQSLDKWLPTLKHWMVQHQGRNFSTFDMWFEAERTPESIRNIMKEVSIYVGDMNAPFWSIPMGFVDKHLKVRVIVIADAGPKYREQVPGLVMEYRNHPMHQLAHMFQHFLLKPLKITDAREAIEQEIVFAGIHKLRNIGINTIENETVVDGFVVGEDEDFSVESNPTTEKSVTESHAHDKCRVCGKPFVEESSEWHINAQLGGVKWRRVHQKVH